MLRSLAIRSFKAYSSVDASFAPFSVLIGQNGAGKTTVLQVLDLMGGLVRGTLSEHLKRRGWEYRDLPHLLEGKLRFGATATLEIETDKLVWDLDLETRLRPGIHQERVERIVGKQPQELLERSGRSMQRWNEAHEETESITQTLTSSWLAQIDPLRDRKWFPGLAHVAAWARGIRSYLFEPGSLRGASRDDVGDPGDSGQNLATFLHRVKSKDPTAFEAIVYRVQEHYPRLDSIAVKRTAYGWTNIEVVERSGKKRVPFNARQVSDGLLRLVAVSALHAVGDGPRLFLLDEIENGMHPHLLGGFVTMLQDLVDENPGTQVIATTHSPIALNAVRHDDSVLLVHRLKGGAAGLTPLSHAKDYARLRRHFDLGELWYNVGEDKLVTAGGPT